MKSQLRCQCNDRWMPYVPLEVLHLWGDIQCITDQKLRCQSVHTPRIECPVCGYNMWYCAYQEDMLVDLKEINE